MFAFRIIYWPFSHTNKEFVLVNANRKTNNKINKLENKEKEINNIRIVSMFNVEEMVSPPGTQVL